MLNKVCGLARAIAVILAIIAGFVALGGLDIALTLVVLGLVAGIALPQDDLIRMGLNVLVLPLVGAALGNIPAVGEQLGAVAGNLALAAAGAFASAFAIRVFNVVKGDLMGLAAK